MADHFSSSRMEELKMPLRTKSLKWRRKHISSILFWAASCSGEVLKNWLLNWLRNCGWLRKNYLIYFREFVLFLRLTPYQKFLYRRCMEKILEEKGRYLFKVVASHLLVVIITGMQAWESSLESPRMPPSQFKIWIRTSTTTQTKIGADYENVETILSRISASISSFHPQFAHLLIRKIVKLREFHFLLQPLLK